MRKYDIVEAEPNPFLAARGGAAFANGKREGGGVALHIEAFAEDLVHSAVSGEEALRRARVRLRRNRRQIKHFRKINRYKNHTFCIPIFDGRDPTATVGLQLRSGKGSYLCSL